MAHAQRVREDRIYRHVKTQLKSGVLPTSDDVRAAINSLVGSRRQELLRYHKFWPELTLRRGLDSLLRSAHQASVDVSRHDAVLGALADSTEYQYKTNHAVGHVAQKDIIAYCALALGIRDTLKDIQRLRRDIAVNLSEIEDQLFSTDISEFVRKLRNNLLHGRVLVPQWNVSYHEENHIATGSMRYSVHDLKTTGKWNKQSQRFMQSATNEHLHLSTVLRDHFVLVNQLKLRLDALFARHVTQTEWDYWEIEDSHKRVLRNKWTKVLISQVWDQKDPYSQLHRFFKPEVHREILRYPRHSKEQVDFMITLKSSEMDCDDELRQTLYRVFSVVPES